MNRHAIADTIIRLSPWTNHHSTCARVIEAGAGRGSMNWRCRLFGHAWLKSYRVGSVCGRCLVTVEGDQYPMKYGWPPIPDPWPPAPSPPPPPLRPKYYRDERVAR